MALRHAEMLQQDTERGISCEPSQLVHLVSSLRWAIPLAACLIGAGYALLDKLVIEKHDFWAPHVLGSVLFFGLAGSSVAWLMLGWASKAAAAEAVAQQELADRNKEMATLNAIGEAASRSLDLEEILRTALEKMALVIKLEAGEIWLVEGTRLVLKAHCGVSPHFVERERGIRLGSCSCGTCAQTGEVITTSGLILEPSMVGTACDREGFKSGLCVPMKAEGRVVGVVHVASRQMRAFSMRDREVLTAIGRQVAMAVENRRLFQETKRRFEAMIALHEASLNISRQLDREELLESLVRRAASLVGAQAGVLFLCDAANGLLRNVACYNTMLNWTGMTVRPGQEFLGRVVVSGEPLITNDYQDWAQKNGGIAISPNIAIMAAPLKCQDETIGGILVRNECEKGIFHEYDLWLFSLFADLAAIAVRNAQLHTRVKEFSLELERKVGERTRELATAGDEIAAKAEQLRMLYAKTVRIQEEERNRIAHDMHDGVAQLISAARYELQAVKLTIKAKSIASAQEKLNTASEVLDEMEREIRRTINDLHPPILDAVGLVPAVSRYADSFQEFSGIACRIETIGSPSRLSSAVEVSIYRMVAEALQNVATHSGARTASVTLQFRPTYLRVAVKDDGQGFDYRRCMGDRHGGLGLAGMRERARSLGGSMKVWSKPGYGTHLAFRIPVGLH